MLLLKTKTKKGRLALSVSVELRKYLMKFAILIALFQQLISQTLVSLVEVIYI